MSRGALTDKIQELAKGFLGREITVKELRIYPYLDYVMKNEQHIKPALMANDERPILRLLKDAGHIEGGAAGLTITRKFYNYMNDVLWYGYVNHNGEVEDEN